MKAENTKNDQEQEQECGDQGDYAVGNGISEKILFSEYEEANDCIEILTRATTTRNKNTISSIDIDGDSNGGNNRNNNNNSNFIFEDCDDNNIYTEKCNAIMRLRCIYDKYLQCPTLLDRFIEPMMNKLTTSARDTIDRSREYDNGNNSNNNNECSDNVSIESSNLLFVLSAIYSLSKVRGRKNIQRFFPHNVRDVQPIFASLYHLSKQVQQKQKKQQQKMEQPQIWECIYILWIWMGMLSYVPFDCSVIIDSSFITSFIQLSKEHLANTGPIRDVASNSLSLWLCRPDFEQNQLPLFVTWSTQNIIQQQKYSTSYHSNTINNQDSKKKTKYRNNPYIKNNNENNSRNNNTNTKLNNKNDTIFLLLGTLQTLVGILKLSTGNREALVQRLLPLWEPMIAFVESDTSSCNHNVLLRKLMVKWWSRMGCAFLPPNIPKWRYKRGRRILSIHFQESSSASSTNKTSTRTTPILPSSSSSSKNVLQPKGGCNNYNKKNSTFVGHSSQQQEDNNNDQDQDHHHEHEEFQTVLDQAEDAMGYIIESLNDKSTVVRYSAAKGVGRLTERLPCVCSHDVLDAILELFVDEEKDQAWHGACLALAELARRGLLLPSRLNDIIPNIIRAIHYDKRRGGNSSSSSGSSIGAHVRDAACYTYWAFARAYAPSILKPYLQSLSESIIVTFLFDREINCRRAANAAFQEFVGRQGSENFKHGISILTVADYFSLGNRKDSYSSVAYHIAKLSIEYRRPIIDELYTTKLYHWDGNIRILASKSLYELTLLDVPYICEVVLPFLLRNCLDEKNLFVRHGSILGIAEIIFALGSSSTTTTCANNNNNTDSDATTTTTAGRNATSTSSQNKVNQVSKQVISKASLISAEATCLKYIKNETMASVLKLVQNIEKKRLYRGRGGEIIRSAICRFIWCVSKVNIPFSVKQQVGLLDTVDSNIPHPNENIQQKACNALHELMRTYFPVLDPITKGPTDRLQKRVVDKYIDLIYTKNDNPAITRGFTTALGSLPAKLLAPVPNPAVLDNVLKCLCKASENKGNNTAKNTNAECNDPETRRNALIALRNVCETVGVGCGDGYRPGSSKEEEDLSTTTRINTTVGLNSAQVSRVFDSFFLALQDYSIDRRGDVGSWVRIAAMDGLVKLSFLTTTGTKYSTNNNIVDNNIELYFNQSICVRMLGAILKQFAEKLDTVREHAGKCLEKIVTYDQDPFINYIPQRQFLLGCLDTSSLITQKHEYRTSTTAPISTVAAGAPPPASAAASPTTLNRNKNEKGGKMDWSNGLITFPMIMNIAHIDDFFPDIIAGIVISVGGLTESVSEHATESLLHWTKEGGCNHRREIKNLGDVILQLFQTHSRNGRVINPLLKTVDTLMTHQCLDEIILLDDSSSSANDISENKHLSSCFSESLLSHLITEEKNCNDVHRLFGIIDVSLSLLSAFFSSTTSSSIESYIHIKTKATETKIINKILIFVCSVLHHRFPRVRRYTAENFYVTLLEHSNAIPGVSCSSDTDCGNDGNNDSRTTGLLDLLLNSPWDAALDNMQIIDVAGEVAQLLGIKLSNHMTPKPQG